MNKMENETFKRISKAAARKMWNTGKAYEIYVMPCKVRLGGMWFYPVPLCYPDGKTVFDNAVNEYEIFNCCAEVGKYSSFFVKKDV